MAKGSPLGLWKGKKGSTVFYRLWNSANKEIQGMREYRAEISNPQTDAQATQRAKLLPAQLIRGALYDIVSRSFQGIAYGAKSRLEFRKYAMRLTSGYPYLNKGETRPVPGEYLIAKGTLQPVQLFYDSEAQNFVSDINITVDPTGATIAEMSEDILENNPQFNEGDQLTFVVCSCSNLAAPLSANYYWSWYSFIIDTTDTGSFTVAEMAFPEPNLGRLQFNDPNDTGCAAGVIVSRLGTDGLYQRSNTKLTVQSAMEPWFGPTRASDTTRSYQNTGSRVYDWPVEADATRAGGGSIADGSYTLSGLTGNMASLNGSQVRTQNNSLTGQPVRVYVKDWDGVVGLIDPAGNPLTYTGSGSELTYLRKQDVPALASLPEIEVD